MIELAVSKSLHGSGGAIELDVELRIESGAFMALAGPSGSGKTTLLRILAGLEEANGQLRVDGETWLDGRRMLPPQRRSIGFVFQDYALFENMSVERNLLYASADPVLADELLDLTGLEALRTRLPSGLSGGQRQRVALCRALMRRPKLLLMDEPLSALDPAMRAKLQRDILTLHRTFGTTTLMVSHDPSEIYRLAGRVAVLHGGRIVRDGSPREVLLHAAGSQKFSLRGELLEIVQSDVIHIAVVAIGQQIVEVVIDSAEARSFQAGDEVQVSTKAFAPALSKVSGKTGLL